jgi:hypothetical protein
MQLFHTNPNSIRAQAVQHFLANPDAKPIDVAKLLNASPSNFYFYRKLASGEAINSHQGAAMFNKVTDYLRRHPKATAAKIARALGTSKGNVYNHTRKAREIVMQERAKARERMGSMTAEPIKINLGKDKEKAFADLAFELSRGRSAPDPTPAPDTTPAATAVPTSMTYQVGGDHYKDNPVQPWAAMEAWMGGEQFVGFLRGNVIKYIARCDKKGGVQDLKKAQHYLTKLIEICDGEKV